MQEAEVNDGIHKPATESCNAVRTLSFSGSHIHAEWVSRVQHYAVPGDAVVVNVSPANASILNHVVPVGEQVIRASFGMRPWRSALLHDGVVEKADSIVVLRVTAEKNIGNLVLDPTWQLFGDTVGRGSPFPRDTPLWRSSQDDLCSIDVDPYEFAGQPPRSREQLRLKVNLWYAPPHTDCFIHTQHPFLEVHTQVYGTGRMQKFRAMDEATLYEDVVMPVGLTHEPFFVVDQPGRLNYPWHRYYADSSCVWMAIELHRSNAHRAE
jgi:hypothetical protein